MFSENYSRQTAIASVNEALDPNLTDHDLAQLAHSPEAKIRALAAEHVRTPLTTLLTLAKDESPGVRAGVARNVRADIPEELRRDLAHDTHTEVLLALIRNEAVADGIVARLARHRNNDVAAAVRARLVGRGGKARLLGAFGIATS